MGTRGALGFKIGNTYKVSYNHFDSYPEGLGLEVIDFIKRVGAENGFDQLKVNARLVNLIGEETPCTPEMAGRYKEFSDFGVSSKSTSDWYCVLRNAQGIDGLNAVYEGKLQHMIDAHEFLKDSLFCEYAYILDMDFQALIFCKGFQKQPIHGSPFGEEMSNKMGYYPVKVADMIAFSTILESDTKKLVERMDEHDREED